MPTIEKDVAVGQHLLQRMLEARRRSDALFALVKTEAIYDRPIPERHRIIFYVGHLEAFDWNLLHERALGTKSFHPDLDRLFAFGIDPVGGGLPSDQPSDWPSARNRARVCTPEQGGAGRETLDSRGRRRWFGAVTVFLWPLC